MSLAIMGVLISIVGLIIFDIFLVVKKGWKETISFQVYILSRDNPIIPFAIGVVMGHLFWPQNF